MEIKPYTFVKVQQQGYSYIGECMSFETPEHTAVIRRVPGFPGTVEELPVGMLTESPAPPKYVHYARVSGHGHFPVDMLRYDSAAPVNFSIVQYESGPKAEIIESFGLTELWIASADDCPVPTWTRARWSSFLWWIDEIKTERL